MNISKALALSCFLTIAHNASGMYYTPSYQPIYPTYTYYPQPAQYTYYPQQTAYTYVPPTYCYSTDTCFGYYPTYYDSYYWDSNPQDAAKSFAKALAVTGILAIALALINSVLHS